MGQTERELVAKGAVVAFEVSDFAAFVRKLRERAIVFVAEPFDTPICKRTVIVDEDGNRITIHKRHVLRARDCWKTLATSSTAKRGNGRTRLFSMSMTPSRL